MAAAAVAHPSGRHGEAFARQVLSEVAEGRSFLAEYIGDRYPDVGERDLAGIAEFQTDLVQSATNFEAGGFGVDDKQREPASAILTWVAGTGDHDHVCRLRGVGDKGLCAVEDVAFSVVGELRGGANGGQIRTRPRLGHRHGKHGLPTRTGGQPALLLILVCESEQVGQNDSGARVVVTQ